ncbi:Fic family protein [Deinococcus cellulosilyticus]|uniref:Fido domain-containing protein n=1 Tax=Deinococcus cellulosilyticus (strain DSM 18568 / NBRC 106333 / KACC 11606 / 5516J-15) TaxID=1223518 RepID=A0A511NCI3_DEIC1|nr:Fic family protein [Deinococcus cellulosilyticus]GEM50051.1 hypothetical protein DC3_56860 [Deinococcus cellulosilyticus NBRC 106333 = KACC 11606]
MLEVELLHSYRLEGELPRGHEIPSLIADLLQAERGWDIQKALVGWHHRILPGLGWESAFRTTQNYVGETLASGEEVVHFVCPKPDDVRPLMRGWFELHHHLREQHLHPVMAAGVLGFSLVFIHPFLDGNGRLHRLMMLHHLMHSLQPSVPLPISRVILRWKDLYQQVLDQHSREVMDHTPFRFSATGHLEVLGDTLHLHQDMDLTVQVAFFMEVVEEAIKVDLPELWAEFVPIYELTLLLGEVLTWPQRRLRMLASMLIQGGGKLSKTRKKRFWELNNQQLQEVENRARAVLARLPTQPDQGEISG